MLTQFASFKNRSKRIYYLKTCFQWIQGICSWKVVQQAFVNHNTPIIKSLTSSRFEKLHGMSACACIVTFPGHFFAVKYGQAGLPGETLHSFDTPPHCFFVVWSQVEQSFKRANVPPSNYSMEIERINCINTVLLKLYRLSLHWLRSWWSYINATPLLLCYAGRAGSPSACSTCSIVW